MTDEGTFPSRVPSKKHKSKKLSASGKVRWRGSHNKSIVGMERSTRALPTYEGPSLGHGGKAIDSFDQNGPCLGEEKGNTIISSKSGFGYMTCSWKELEDMILRNTNRPFEVPREALSRKCSLGEISLRAYLSYLSLHPPYLSRLVLDNEGSFFPSKGEVGVYLGHFIASLRFPLDLDLMKIFCFYNVTLCRYSPASIGCMIGFNSLLRLTKLHFLVDSFHYFFYVRIIRWNPECGGSCT